MEQVHIIPVVVDGRVSQDREERTSRCLPKTVFPDVGVTAEFEILLRIPPPPNQRQLLLSGLRPRKSTWTIYRLHFSWHTSTKSENKHTLE